MEERMVGTQSAAQAAHPVGILSAMPSEIAFLLARMEGVVTERHAAVDYHAGCISGVPVILCNGGVGKVNAAMHTQLLVDRYAPRAIIQNGLAGSLSPGLGIFDFVIGTELVYHDMQKTILENYEPLQPVYHADMGLVTVAGHAAPFGRFGRIATGDVFVSDPALRARIARETGACCVEMEGCAVAHTATLNGVPFLVLRTISDMADSRAPETFDQFEQKAADRSCSVVLDILGNMGGNAVC